jgi:hypothetical protein
LGVQQPAFSQQQTSSPAVHKQSIGGVKPPFMQQQPQIRTAQIPISNIPPKPQQVDVKKLQGQTTPRRSQNPSASNSQISTPGEPSSSLMKNPGTLPVAVVGPMHMQGKPETTVQATVPLSRPITPTFASSIGIQFPPGTALASQLAGAAKLGGKATFGTKSAVCENLRICLFFFIFRAIAGTEYMSMWPRLCRNSSKTIPKWTMVREKVGNLSF